MKVLMIGPFPPIVNGVTISNDFLYRWLKDKGWQVSKINTETGKIASLQGDRISFIKIFTFLSIYTNIFRITGKDTIYMTVGQTFWGLAKYLPFVLYCRLLHIPYIFHIHGGYLCQSYEKMSRRKQGLIAYLINNSAGIIALSHSLATEIKKTFIQSRVHIVENFYEEELIRPVSIRKKNNMPHFLFLSNLMLGKGILEFLDALVLLDTTHKLDFRVALAGNIEKGMHAEIQKRTDRLQDKIHFFGLADFQTKKELLYWSDIFVLPTWYIMEGQPLSIIEAYVTGNIVVSTYQGGIQDISNYDTFYYVDPQHTDKLAETLMRATSELPHIAENIIQTATATQKRFNPEQFVEKIQQILASAE